MMSALTDAICGFGEALTSAVASGRSGRGVSGLCSPEYWSAAAEQFAGLNRVAIVSGFYVPAAEAAETDGPGGAVILARAFLDQGIEVNIWTDSLCVGVIKSCAAAVGFPLDLVTVPESDEILDSYLPSGVLFVERLGRAMDGKYYNIAKRDISSWTAPLDGLALLSSVRGIKTLGIGDGGNEIGMGCFYDKLSGLLPDYSNCLSVVKTDIALPVDVSNWGAYAFAAALSLRWGVWRGHEKNEEAAMLEALRNSGAVDGISLSKDMSVDGFPLSVHESVVANLYDIWQQSN